MDQGREGGREGGREEGREGGREGGEYKRIWTSHVAGKHVGQETLRLTGIY